MPIGQVEHLAGTDLAHVVEKFAGCGYKHCCHPTSRESASGTHAARIVEIRGDQATLPKSP
jgi:hypothetical protein